MKLNTFLFGTATAILAGGMAMAAPQDTINEIIDGFAGQGYTHIQIQNGVNRIKVEAQGPNGSLERTYDANGNIIREESHSGDFSDNDKRSASNNSDDHDDDHDSNGRSSSGSDDGDDHDSGDDHDFGGDTGGYDGSGSHDDHDGGKGESHDSGDDHDD